VFTSRFQKWVRRNAQRLAALLARLRVTPNQVTVAGMVFTFASAALVASGRLLAGGLVLLFSGTFDILDGALARASNRSYPYGAFLDSSIDRLSEGAIYLALAFHFAVAGGPQARWLVGATVLALIGSFEVSYVRARAQSLGFSSETGLFNRPERVVATIAGLVAAGLGFPDVLTVVIVGLAVLAHLTALQRIWEVWSQARAQRRTARSAIPEAPRGATADRPRH
jgi:CDP-diacylglycerol--glycerol-3-phosphate 3-phosphatidyltransferase